MSKLLIFLTLIFVFSCNNNSQRSTEEENKADTLKIKNNAALAGELCFSKMEKDTVLLQINISNSVVSGNLTYRLFEKDANNGKLKGRFYGDTLIADYDFISEGIQSIRQVAFLIKDSTALEGFGEMKEENNRMEFKNPHEINFENGIILKKTICDRTAK